jgi:hypothetical protein
VEKNIDPLIKKDKTWEPESGIPFIASSNNILEKEIILFNHLKGNSYVMHQQFNL